MDFTKFCKVVNVILQRKYSNKQLVIPALNKEYDMIEYKNTKNQREKKIKGRLSKALPDDSSESLTNKNNFGFKVSSCTLSQVFNIFAGRIRKNIQFLLK